nr:immunoglobulin light chain junction region [Macaca mulatta]MOV76323.1 immunoglobulin light chain junction region [Macaca mulatta]
CQQHDSEPFSF